MKKYVILIIILVVCWFGFSYHHRMLAWRGEQLVTHAYYGNLIAVKDEVEKGAPLNYVLWFDEDERNYKGKHFNALHAAASSGNVDIILYLLEQGIPIDITTKEGWTPLFIAAREGHAEAAKLLIYKQAAINIQTDMGATALTMVLTQPYPTEKDRLDLLEYMLRRGANPALKDRYGHDAWYYAKQMNNDGALELLEQYTAEKNNLSPQEN